MNLVLFANPNYLERLFRGDLKSIEAYSDRKENYEVQIVVPHKQATYQGGGTYVIYLF